MEKEFELVSWEKKGELPKDCCVAAGQVEDVRAFHSGIPGYACTPLVNLGDLAKKLSIKQFTVKDESKRFGLNAFKSLGGSYAIAKQICKEIGLPLNEQTYELLHSEKYATMLEKMTVVTATDGNHGRGVAWTAKMLGCKAVVYLPKGTVQERLDNILAQGAQAEITEMVYDDTVRHASKMAKEHGWLLVQDTSWEGYTEIPSYIMQGYTTLAKEIVEQLEEQKLEKPTHLFLQAGVGSMAGAIAGYFSSLWKEECPKIIVVEPTTANCHYLTAKAADGKLHAVQGEMKSMMAGLCCGEPCTLSWEILEKTASAFVACADYYSAEGMRLLGRPFGQDTKIVSGESGAATAGVAAALCVLPELEKWKCELELSETSRILVLSTEGDTDRQNYQAVLEKKCELV